MEPQNAIIGDSTGVELPHMQIEDQTLVEEKKMAKYSRSTEFKRIQQWCEDRISFYQIYLPNGAEVGMEVVPTPEDWRVANRVIAEFKALMNSYEIANDAVKEDAKAKNT
jgi:hypothetical protein